MQNKWDKEQLEIQRYLGRTNVLGKSLQKGRKIKKKPISCTERLYFQSVRNSLPSDVTCPCESYHGLGCLTNVLWENWLKWRPCQWDRYLSKDRAFMRWIYGSSPWVCCLQTNLLDTLMMGGGLPFQASVVAGDWELLWCKGEWHVLIWHRRRSIIYTDYWVVLSNPILCLGPVYLSGITGIKIISEQMLAF